MEISGTIKVIKPEQSVSNSFKKRELVITTQETYPQHLMVEFTQDKCALLDQFAVGDFVKVSINLRGREWTSPQGEIKYFNSIQGWKIIKEGGADPGSEMPMTLQESLDSGSDDLPF